MQRRSGCSSDWHIGNVGFSDSEPLQRLLVDWETNIPSGAADIYHECVTYAVQQFHRHLTLLVAPAHRQRVVPFVS